VSVRFALVAMSSDDHADKGRFEFARNLADGTEETRIILVQEMLDLAAELDPLASYCIVCPANVSGEAFGCCGQISYPISSQAEAWLLDQLPALMSL